MNASEREKKCLIVEGCDNKSIRILIESIGLLRVIHFRLFHIFMNDVMHTINLLATSDVRSYRVTIHSHLRGFVNVSK